ncbi:hypothetical protein MASR2M39_27840 [Ignavibacteriales bacterium]
MNSVYLTPAILQILIVITLPQYLGNSCFFSPLNHKNDLMGTKQSVKTTSILILTGENNGKTEIWQQRFTSFTIGSWMYGDERILWKLQR